MKNYHKSKSGRACVKLEKKKKYTLRYLANKIGLSSGSTISNWELGLNLPNKRYLKKSLKPVTQQ